MIKSGQLSDRGNIVGWCGYLYEEATGMWLARHRWQIPELGRWANRDPIGYAGGGQNLYEYVNGNPVLLRDPSGLYPPGDLNDMAISLSGDRNWRGWVYSMGMENMAAQNQAHYLDSLEKCYAKDVGLQELYYEKAVAEYAVKIAENEALMQAVAAQKQAVYAQLAEAGIAIGSAEAVEIMDASYKSIESIILNNTGDFIAEYQGSTIARRVAHVEIAGKAFGFIYDMAELSGDYARIEETRVNGGDVGGEWSFYYTGRKAVTMASAAASGLAAGEYMAKRGWKNGPVAWAGSTLAAFAGGMAAELVWDDVAKATGYVSPAHDAAVAKVEAYEANIESRKAFIRRKSTKKNPNTGLEYCDCPDWVGK